MCDTVSITLVMVSRFPLRFLLALALAAGPTACTVERSRALGETCLGTRECVSGLECAFVANGRSVCVAPVSTPLPPEDDAAAPPPDTTAPPDVPPDVAPDATAPMDVAPDVAADTGAPIDRPAPADTGAPDAGVTMDTGVADTGVADTGHVDAARDEGAETG